MVTAMVSSAALAEAAVLPAASLEERWYAAYTSANHEKRVAEQLKKRSVEQFVPLYASVRRWKDRRVELEMPLFPGYVFVRMALQNRLRVLQVPGVAKLVGFGGAPTALPEGEIETLRASLESGVRAEPHPFLTAGRRVRVKTGPLAGLQGILVRRKKQARFVVSVELIMRSMAVEIDAAELEPIRRDEGAGGVPPVFCKCCF
jgi:transcription termination/antitermination protein NusG